LGTWIKVEPADLGAALKRRRGSPDNLGVLIATPDGSLYGPGQRLVHLGIARFVKDVVERRCCFVCGIERAAGPFTGEHVIPDWLLRMHGLHDAEITLPNRRPLRYSRYRVACCGSCNASMGKAIEQPMRERFSAGYVALHEAFARDESTLPAVFDWLALLFLKTHLHDLSLRYHLDHRLGEGAIAELYDWPELHHVHCLARRFHSGASIEHMALGSTFLFRVDERVFDYVDLYYGRVAAVAANGIGLVAVMNDSHAVAQIASRSWPLHKLGVLGSLQFRELVSRLAVINDGLLNRPLFSTAHSADSEETTIVAHVPASPLAHHWSHELFGEQMAAFTRQVIGPSPSNDALDVLARMATGHYSFLFDDDGEFIASGL
jgi:hypothetical protein